MLPMGSSRSWAWRLGTTGKLPENWGASLGPPGCQCGARRSFFLQLEVGWLPQVFFSRPAGCVSTVLCVSLTAATPPLQDCRRRPWFLPSTKVLVRVPLHQVAKFSCFPLLPSASLQV